MTRRAVLGQRGGESGIWVSKPGKDVMTAGPADMLMTMDMVAMQVAIDRVAHCVPNGAGYCTITHPSLGFVGLAFLDFGAWYITDQTTTTIEFFSVIAVDVRFIILNVEIG